MVPQRQVFFPTLLVSACRQASPYWPAKACVIPPLHGAQIAAHLEKVAKDSSGAIYAKWIAAIETRTPVKGHASRAAYASLSGSRVL